MSVKYVFLAVEGPHDQAAVGKLLELCGLQKFGGKRESLDVFWEDLIPTYPPPNGNLYARMDMPSIFTSSTHSIAIYQGIGSNLTKNLVGIMTTYPKYAKSIDVFGLIVDADAKQPEQVVEKYAKGLRSFLPSLSDVPGVIIGEAPRTGIYVLPDNKNTGVLDTVLVNCSSVVYPEHKIGAEQFLNGLRASHTNHWRGFDQRKALVASIVSVLRPGVANTPSIAQDKWINEQTINDVPELVLLKQFLEELLGLPKSTPNS